jgi:hypothetical protein
MITSQIACHFDRSLGAFARLRRSRSKYAKTERRKLARYETLLVQLLR